MKSISPSFYKSPEWKACRHGYLQLHPLCEECLKAGEYTPATHVHHKIWLNETNVRDQAISLNWDNLEAVCIKCHNRIHNAGEHQRRYTVSEDGKVSPLSQSDDPAI